MYEGGEAEHELNMNGRKQDFFSFGTDDELPKKKGGGKRFVEYLTYVLYMYLHTNMKGCVCVSPLLYIHSYSD